MCINSRVLVLGDNVDSLYKKPKKKDDEEELRL